MRTLFLTILAVVASANVGPHKGTHADNWAVLVCTSRYWFNYRHVSNTLAMYHTVKRLGIPDSNIILMLADDMACNARNPFPGSVFLDHSHRTDLYDDDTEVDYAGEEVTVDNLLRVLTGRLPASVAPSKRLASSEGSNLFVYMSGHGGDGFLKFQDAAELTAEDLADAFAEMRAKDRFREALLLFDTCEAESLGAALRTPGVAAVGSSRVGQNSYAHGTDVSLGLAISDGFTYYATKMFEESQMRMGTHANSLTLQDLLDSVPFYKTRSDAVARTDLMRRPPQHIKLSDFVCGVSDVVVF